MSSAASYDHVDGLHSKLGPYAHSSLDTGNLADWQTSKTLSSVIGKSLESNRLILTDWTFENCSKGGVCYKFYDNISPTVIFY